MDDHLVAPSGIRRRGTGRRHGRGVRGPLVMAGPLSRQVKRRHDPHVEFDTLVMAVVDRFERAWGARIRAIEFATEDVPVVPSYWKNDRVPVAVCQEATATTPARIVVFRRPVETRARSGATRALLIHDAVLEQLEQLWGSTPGDLEP